MSINFRYTYKLIASCLLMYASFFVKDIIPLSPDEMKVVTSEMQNEIDSYQDNPIEVEGPNSNLNWQPVQLESSSFSATNQQTLPAFVSLKHNFIRSKFVFSDLP